MTTEEAIKVIRKELHSYCESSGIDCFNSDCENCKIIVAYEKAIIALEKQIPKKPHKNYEKVNLKWCECGNYLGELKNEQNYCKRCGQALDWGEEEC